MLSAQVSHVVVAEQRRSLHLPQMLIACGQADEELLALKRHLQQPRFRHTRINDLSPPIDFCAIVALVGASFDSFDHNPCLVNCHVTGDVQFSTALVSHFVRV